jgi:hypothetical protein
VTPNVQLVDHNLYKKTKQALMQKAPAIAKAIVMNRLVPPNMLAVVNTILLSALMVLAS